MDHHFHTTTSTCQPCSLSFSFPLFGLSSPSKTLLFFLSSPIIQVGRPAAMMALQDEWGGGNLIIWLFGWFIVGGFYSAESVIDVVGGEEEESTRFFFLWINYRILLLHRERENPNFFPSFPSLPQKNDVFAKTFALCIPTHRIELTQEIFCRSILTKKTTTFP